MENFKLTLDYVGTYASKSNTNYTFFVKASSLKEELLEWIDVNPRLQKMNIVNKIKESALTEPKHFINKNNGIFLSVDLIAVENNNKVHLYFNNREIHGILNGGHTYRALSTITKKEYEELDDDVIVTVNIISGIEAKETIVPIAIAKNDGEKVSLKSVVNLKSHFELIKDTLNIVNYQGAVSYKQNEDRNLVEVVDIIKLLAVFDITEQAPWRIMNGFKNIFDYYERNLVKEDSFMTKLIKYDLVDLFELYGFIEENIYSWYGEFCATFGGKVSVGTAVGVNVLDANDKTVKLRNGFPCVEYNMGKAIYPSLFNRDKLIKSKVPAPFVFIVCRALTVYLKENETGLPMFTTDVITLLKENKELRLTIIKPLLKEIAKLGWHNITVTSLYKKNAEDVWKSVGNEVLSYAYRSAL